MNKFRSLRFISGWIVLMLVVGCTTTSGTDEASSPAVSTEAALQTSLAVETGSLPTHTRVQEGPPTSTSIPDQPEPAINEQSCILTADKDWLRVYEIYDDYYVTSVALGFLHPGETVEVLRDRSNSDATWYEVTWHEQTVLVQVTDKGTLSGTCKSLVYGVPVQYRPDVIDYTISVSGIVGTVEQFTQVIPSENGDLEHTLQIRVDLAEGAARWVSYELVCSGGDADELRWGWWHVAGEPPTQRCGESGIQEPADAHKFHHLVVSVPEDSAGVTYTLVISITEYSP